MKVKSIYKTSTKIDFSSTMDLQSIYILNTTIILTEILQAINKMQDTSVFRNT